MSRLQQMRLAASATQTKEPSELLDHAFECWEHGDTISAAACLARAEEIKYERQAIIRRRVSG